MMLIQWVCFSNNATLYLKAYKEKEVLLWLSLLEHSSRMWKVGFSNPSHDRPKWYKQVVTAPLPNTRQLVHAMCPQR